MARHLVDEQLIAALSAGAPVTARWRALMEELMAVADVYYARAFEALPALPRHARAPIAVAALVYQGIHSEVRRNGYDNLTRRAHTSLPRKLWLGARALARLPQQRAFGSDQRRTLVPAGVRSLAAAAGAAALALVLASGVAGQQAAGAGAAEALPAAAAHDHARTPAAGMRASALGSVATPASSRIARLRLLHQRAIDDEHAMARAEALLDTLAGEAGAAPLLTAYRGAFRLLRAKHGSWPPARLRDARAGLRLLDHAVRNAPSDLEVRYLRLVNDYHLPGIFRRADVVRADFAAAALLLPERARQHDPQVVGALAQFVLARGRLDAGTRAALVRWWHEHA
jgi:hypothetical protein